MPLSVNVGLSRKASRDFQSIGSSINVTAELDATLLSRPDELQQQIAALYREAEQALDRQAAAAVQPRPLQPVRQAPSDLTRSERRSGFTPRPNGQGNGHAGNSNGHSATGNGRHAHGPAATASQRRAIDSICRRLGLDAAEQSREIIGSDLEQLSVKQASELISFLLEQDEQPARGGGR
jgi:hypothetical protein